MCFWLSCAGSLSLAQEREGRLKVKLSCGDFSDHCILILKKGGEEAERKDQDARKIGEGYIGVAILGAEQEHFSIQERPVSKGHKEYGLFVKGFPSDHYQLRIEGMDVVLEDKVEKHLIPVPSRGALYNFSIDSRVGTGMDGLRFALHVEPFEEQLKSPVKPDKVLAVYPNPWKEKFTLRFKENPETELNILIRDTSGSLIWCGHAKRADDQNELLLDCGKQSRGIYFLQVLDAFLRPVSKTIKLIHE